MKTSHTHRSLANKKREVGKEELILSERGSALGGSKICIVGV